MPTASKQVLKKAGLPDLESDETHLMVTPSQIIDNQFVPTPLELPAFAEKKSWAGLVKRIPGGMTTLVGLFVLVAGIILFWPDGAPPKPAPSSQLADSNMPDSRVQPAAGKMPESKPAIGSAPATVASKTETAKPAATDSAKTDATPDKDTKTATATVDKKPRTPVRTKKKRKRITRRSQHKPSGHGFLTLNSSPWSEVWFKGKKIGITPLAYHKMPTGRHKLRLRNPPRGIDKTIWLRIYKGETTTKQIDLQ
jgi:hypothetical protein